MAIKIICLPFQSRYPIDWLQEKRRNSTGRWAFVFAEKAETRFHRFAATYFTSDFQGKCASHFASDHWIKLTFINEQETKRPSKEMQVTIARQLGLEPTTVGNFFMNARRRSMDKWKDEADGKNGKEKLWMKSARTLNISIMKLP